MEGSEERWSPPARRSITPGRRCERGGAGARARAEKGPSPRIAEADLDAEGEAAGADAGVVQDEVVGGVAEDEGAALERRDALQEGPHGHPGVHADGRADASGAGQPAADGAP